MGITAVVMFVGITALALITKVHKTTDTCQLVGYPGTATRLRSRP